MRYYKLEFDLERPDNIICHYRHDYGMSFSMFCRGQKETKPDDRFCFTYSLDEDMVLTDMLANDKGWFVVSKKLKDDVLYFANTQIQYFPISIQCDDRAGTQQEYFIANILSVVNALSLELSEYSVFQSAALKRPFYAIRKYAIHAEKTGNIDLFRLPDENVYCIFGSERIKQQCEANGITGIKFIQAK